MPQIEYSITFYNLSFLLKEKKLDVLIPEEKLRVEVSDMEPGKSKQSSKYQIRNDHS